MKTEELRELPLSEVRKHLEETREELFNLRFQGATGQLENYKRLGLMRREIARTLTVIRERELGIERDVLGEKPDDGSDEEKGRRGLRRRRRSKGTRSEKGEE